MTALWVAKAILYLYTVSCGAGIFAFAAIGMLMTVVDSHSNWLQIHETVFIMTLTGAVAGAVFSWMILYNAKK